MPFITFSALLLVIVVTYVVALMPPGQKPNEQQWLLQRQMGRNCIEAQRLIEDSLPAPFTHWIGPLQGGMIGRDIWYFEGSVGMNSFGTATSEPWKIVYVPETGQILYRAIGSQEQGNLNAALQTAGVELKKR